MKFVPFEDITGIYETVFFPKAYHQFCHVLNEMRPYLLKGNVEQDFTAVTLTVHWVGFLDRSKEDKLALKKRLLITSPLLALKKPVISPKI
jgi:DNA polymerase III alpha subunit